MGNPYLIEKISFGMYHLTPNKTTQALQGLCFGRVSVPYLKNRSISFNYPFWGDRLQAAVLYGHFEAMKHDFPNIFSVHEVPGGLVSRIS